MTLIRGLERFWAGRTGRAAPAPLALADRMRLDALGLGLEQTLAHLAAAPGLADFEAWVVATAGPPDPVKVARFHAWLDGAPPPEPVRAHQAAIAAAPDVLDAGQLAQWEAQGWVVLRSAIARDEARAAEALLWRMVEAAPDDPGSWHGSARNCGIMVQHFQAPELEAARTSARVHKAFAQLWGTADLWTTIDRMSFSPPERPGRPYGGPPLHWDVEPVPPVPFATQAILYLTDTAADQGALRLVPGSRAEMAERMRARGHADLRADDLTALAVPIAAGAGDLVIWRQDLPHGPSPNRARLPRMAQYVNMYAPGAPAGDGG